METVVLFQWQLKKELLDDEGKLPKCPICLSDTDLGKTDEIMESLFVYHCWKCNTHILFEDQIRNTTTIIIKALIGIRREGFRFLSFLP